MTSILSHNIPTSILSHNIPSSIPTNTIPSSILSYVISTRHARLKTGGGDEKKVAFNEKRNNTLLPDDALAGLTSTTDECAEGIGHIPGTPCSSKKVISLISKYMFNNPRVEIASKTISTYLPKSTSADSKIVRAAASQLGCSSESCVLAHNDLKQYIVNQQQDVPSNILALELVTRFKAPGPRNNTSLLSNFNIDETLQRWARVFQDFFPCPFAMMDFDHNGDYFGDADLPAILEGKKEANLGASIGKIRRKFSCFGCVVNTDTSSGPGKHWVAVFVDCRPPPGKAWTVEYFNSVGKPPTKQITYWMEKTRKKLADYRTERADCKNSVCDVIAVPVTDIDHQESYTECGLYALFYIRRRLEGTDYSFFENKIIPDSAMTTFRQHIFRVV